MRRISSPAFILVIVALAAATLTAPAVAEEKPSYQWFSTIRDGNYFQYKGECAEARAKYEEALALSADEEQKADVLVRIAKTYEGEIRRDEAIAAWKRILDECPSSGHLPWVYFRLGELHRSISLVSANASDEEHRRAHNEMRDEEAAFWFEKAVETGPPANEWVLSSKLYLAGIYFDMGRRSDGLAVLEEMSTLAPLSITSPNHVGPFKRMNDTRVTLSERLDETRASALKRRRAARTRLVGWSVTPGDAARSIADLSTLAAKYEGTEIGEMARQKIDAILTASGLPLSEDLQLDGEDDLPESP